MFRVAPSPPSSYLAPMFRSFSTAMSYAQASADNIGLPHTITRFTRRPFRSVFCGTCEPRKPAKASRRPAKRGKAS